MGAPLTFIIFLLVGGMQSLWGPVAAAVVLTALPEVTRFADEYRLILYGAVIVIVVLFRPEGLITRRSTGPSGNNRPLGGGMPTSLGPSA